MRRRVVLHGLLIGLSVLSICETVRAFSGTGSGTEADPYIITNVSQLQEMKDNLSAWYELGNDIDASDTRNWNGGDGFRAVGDDSARFSGHLDGQGHTITGLHIINRVGTAGLFGWIGLGAEIRDLRLIESDVTGSGYVGGLAGVCFDGAVTNTWCTGNVKGANYVGGLIGATFGNSILSQSYFAGVVTATSYGVGGLVGHHSQGSLIRCYSTGSVELGNTSGDIGGLVGSLGGGMTDSYSDASVTGGYFSGGLVGAVGASAGPMTNCYSAGSVNSPGAVYRGGLVGIYWGTPCNSCFWDKETSGQTTSPCGTGKTTPEMKQEATFVGWDFVNVWDIQEGVSYPFLRGIGEPPQPPPPPPPPPPNRAKGIDVSSNQGTGINWEEVRGGGYSFAFARSSWGDYRGVQGRDGTFTHNMNEGHRPGVFIMGAYHFAYPVENSAEAEARFFVDVASDYLRKGYVRPALDMEDDDKYGSHPLDRLKAGPLADWIQTWMNKVKELTGGVEPILYVDKTYAEALKPFIGAQYDLWIANWTCDPADGPHTGGWGNWAFWQYSSPDPKPKGCGAYSIPGIPSGADLDLFNGDPDGLAAYVISVPPPEEVVQDDIRELERLLGVSLRTPLADNLKAAISKANKVCSALAETPPDRRGATQAIEQAVDELEEAIDKELLSRDQGASLIEPLLDVARQLAVDAINHAIVAQGTADRIAEAEEALADGDWIRFAGAYAWAADQYKDAVVSAEKALGKR